MLRKLIAGLLLILSALPFTAPFATVDMPTLFGERSTTASDQTSFTPLVEDGSHALMAPGARTRVRSRSVLRLAIDLTTLHVTLALRGTSPTPSPVPRTPDRPSLTPLRI